LFLSPSESPDADGWGVRNEKDLNVYSTYLDLEPGSVKTVELVFRGRTTVDDGLYTLGTRLPAAAGTWIARFEGKDSGRTKPVTFDEAGNSIFELQTQ
ncbi:MAG: hypothetical protein EB037_03540, partial [Actinobacteria bacterium]|nr:hypothetical protein [Actinomycetota bacterium]